MRRALLCWMVLSTSFSACQKAPVATVRRTLGGGLTAAHVVSSPVSDRAPRVSGGAYRLLRDGRLLRMDRTAKLTGTWETSLFEIASAGALVCGLGNDHQLYCLRDRSGDQRCGRDARLPALVGLGVRFDALDRVNGDGWVCGQTSAGPHCVRVAARCDLACLSFPTCGEPERCIAPCTPGEAPLGLVQIGLRDQARATPVPGAPGAVTGAELTVGVMLDRPAEETFNDFRP